MSAVARGEDGPAYILIVVAAYLYCAASMAVVGMIVPLIDVLAAARHLSPASIGMSISWFSMPAALGSFLFGVIVDRIGVRYAFLVSCVLILLGDGLVLGLPGLMSFRCGLLLSGCGYAFANTASPVLFMQYLPQESQRRRALAFWSTYAPAGYSMGLLAAIPFLHDGNWRAAWNGHALLIVLTATLILLFIRLLRAVPIVRGTTGPRPRLGLARVSLLSIILLGLAVALPNGVAYGTSLIAPHYLAMAHHISLQSSAATVAAIKIGMMLIGGFVVSLRTSTEGRAVRMFFVMGLLGFAAQVGLLLPSDSTVVAVGGLLVWSFVYSGLSGTAMAMLPNVATDEQHRGVVTATISQFSSLSSVVVPYVFFSIKSWNGFLLLDGLMLGIAGCAMLVLKKVCGGSRLGHLVRPAEEAPQG
ncbi:MFS transporter [Acidomonas methanolica]|uniref:MFS transporter n=1 Tax=Acidomonas methanolica TaxID=437 RepID=UPI00211A3FE5|nr:MFS transporter [Acidomonas methanolica]MCQ9154956.1 MFS transporter [Acidomonas methanolica]